MRERRPYQQVAQVAMRQTRMMGLYWARRCRKSTTLGEIYFDDLSKEPGRTVIGCSASLLLGRELVGMTASAIEQAEIVRAEAAAIRGVMESGAADGGLDFKIANSETGKPYANVSTDDFAELYHARKLELQLFFDRTAYSRLLILAPSISTFRSYRALVGFDEIGYMPETEVSDLINSADAMMRDTPDRRMILGSNLSISDKHPWFEMTLPRDMTAPNEEEQFPANPKGHLYIGQRGMLIHRVALKDAYAAGHVLYDDRGQPMTYDEAIRLPAIRSSLDVSYALNHKAGGSAAIDLFALLSAQQRGIGKCSFVYAQNESDFRFALESLRHNLRAGSVGLGYDIATTVKAVSNPSSVTVTERSGTERSQRLVVAWKEKDPAVARERLKAICKTIAQRPLGGPARRLAILATNERYFARDAARELQELVPAIEIIESQNVEPRPGGYEKEVNWKTYGGDVYSAAVNDNLYTLPPGEYFKDDQRMTVKNAGRYECDPDPKTGAHGDTFSSGWAAEVAVSELRAPFDFEPLPQDDYATSRIGDGSEREGRYAL